jgi:hypothetical protein
MLTESNMYDAIKSVMVAENYHSAYFKKVVIGNTNSASKVYENIEVLILLDISSIHCKNLQGQKLNKDEQLVYDFAKYSTRLKISTLDRIDMVYKANSLFEIIEQYLINSNSTASIELAFTFDDEEVCKRNLISNLKRHIRQEIKSELDLEAANKYNKNIREYELYGRKNEIIRINDLLESLMSKIKKGKRAYLLSKLTDGSLVAADIDKNKELIEMQEAITDIKLFLNGSINAIRNIELSK